ncbi:phosphatase PAP2 family protein [Pseudozobellia thermophila]|uniref:Undecaprenyl-diphosphatase n=1 Tax=Pseudozobellia thermophila TaxID=192903 RepID=A0A1M6JUW3_9FLAO|nr:phosphatase PAP2 family protein [Pseudozobellia thermophila]SHJ50487.1 undecaprenyl-diphosphatase [Pseudozobellia thermophila]
MLDKILEWDKAVFVYLNGLGIEDYDVFWTTVTNFTTWIPLFILFIVLIFIKYPKKEAFWVIVTILVMILYVGTLTDLTKHAVARLRPNNNEDINTLIRILKNPSTYSFFSGHSSSSFSITTLVVLFLKNRFKWSWLFYIWPVLFVLSRIFVGVHFPLDILVGALVGVLSALFFYMLYIRFIVPSLGLGRP